MEGLLAPLGGGRVPGTVPVVFKVKKGGVRQGKVKEETRYGDEPPVDVAKEWDTASHTPAYFKALYKLEKIEGRRKEEERKKEEEVTGRVMESYFPSTLGAEEMTAGPMRPADFRSNIERIQEAIEEASAKSSPGGHFEGCSPTPPTPPTPFDPPESTRTLSLRTTRSDSLNVTTQLEVSCRGGGDTPHTPPTPPPDSQPQKSLIYRQELAKLFNAIQPHVRVSPDTATSTASYLVEPLPTTQGIVYTSPTWVIKGKILSSILNGRFDIDSVALLVTTLKRAQDEVCTTRGLLYKCEEMLLREKQRNDILMAREEVAVSRSKYRRMQLIQIATQIHEAVSQGTEVVLPPQDDPDMWKELQGVMECIRSGNGLVDVAKIDVHQRLMQDLTWRTRLVSKERAAMHRLELAERMAMEGADLLSTASQEFTLGGDLKVDILRVLHRRHANGEDFPGAKLAQEVQQVQCASVCVQADIILKDPELDDLAQLLADAKSELQSERKTSMQLRHEKRVIQTEAETLKVTLAQQHEMQANRPTDVLLGPEPPSPTDYNLKLALIDELQEELVASKKCLIVQESAAAKERDEYEGRVLELRTKVQILEGTVAQKEQEINSIDKRPLTPLSPKRIVRRDKATQCNTLRTTSVSSATQSAPRDGAVEDAAQVEIVPEQPVLAVTTPPVLLIKAPRQPEPLPEPEEEARDASCSARLIETADVGLQCAAETTDSATAKTPKAFVDQAANTSHERSPSRPTVLGDILTCSTPLEVPASVQVKIPPSPSPSPLPAVFFTELEASTRSALEASAVDTLVSLSTCCSTALSVCSTALDKAGFNARMGPARRESHSLPHAYANAKRLPPINPESSFLQCTKPFTQKKGQQSGGYSSPRPLEGTPVDVGPTKDVKEVKSATHDGGGKHNEGKHKKVTNALGDPEGVQLPLPSVDGGKSAHSKSAPPVGLPFGSIPEAPAAARYGLMRSPPPPSLGGVQVKSYAPPLPVASKQAHLPPADRLAANVPLGAKSAVGGSSKQPKRERPPTPPTPPTPPPPAAEVPYLDKEIDELVRMVEAAQQRLSYTIAKVQKSERDKGGKSKYHLSLEAKLTKSKERVAKLLKEEPWDVHFQLTAVLAMLQKEVTGWETRQKEAPQWGSVSFGKFGDPAGGDKEKGKPSEATSLGIATKEKSARGFQPGGFRRSPDLRPRYTSTKLASSPPLPRVQGPNPNAHPSVVKLVVPAKIPNLELA